MTLPIVAALIAFTLAWLLTAVVRRYARYSSQLLDVPKARSSHSEPTPRGGGVAIVISFTALLMLVGCTSSALSPVMLSALFGASLPVAMAGFWDDHRPLSARWRVLAHLLGAGWALWCTAGIPEVPMLGFSIDLGWFGIALAAIYLVWMVNLYNFMDGIDGIAGMEAITVSLGGALSWWLATGTPDWWMPVVFAASVGGFLVLNFPPAKIFMGDVGSGFIGMVLGVLSLWTAQQATQVYWSWFILIGCFMVDATTTLLRRVWRGERFHEAHRSHAYQYASRVHGSHKAVSLAVGAINVVWLLPLAVLVALGKLDGVAGTVIAYAPLVWLAFHYKAGDRAAQAA